MKPIFNLKKIKELKARLVSILIENMEDFNINYLERVNWVAVPVEEDPFDIPIEPIEEKSLDIPTEELIQDIKDSFLEPPEENGEYYISFVNALQKAGYKDLYALLLEVVEPEYYESFELEVTKEDMSNFDYECNFLYSIIFPKDFSFIILWLDDYSIIAGKKDFIESLIGCDIETAMNVFKEALNPDWSKQMIVIYKKYKAHNEKVLKALENKES